MSADTTKTIEKSAVRFLSGTLLSRISGMLRDVAMAAAFGTGSEIASFMVAYRFAHLARRLFGEGTLQNIFTPHFEALRHSNRSRAFTFFKDFNASLSLFLFGFILLIIGSIQLGLHFHNFSSKHAEILSLTCLMLPSLIFICLFGLNAALLNCEKKHFLSSSAPIAFNIIWIIAAFCLIYFPIHHAMTALSLAVIVGCFAQWAVTLPAIYKILGSRLFLNARPFSPNVLHLIKPLFLANLGVAASQINNALDPLFAIFSYAEAPAWLWYAIRIQQLPLALFGISLASALIPPISRSIKKGDLNQFHHFFKFAKEKAAAFSLLMTAGIFAMGPSGINLLFGRGQFEMESVAGTSLCLFGYGIGLLPMIYILIAVPALFAFEDYKTPTKASLFAMLLNIALNALFIFTLNWGGESVAFATSIAAFANAYLLVHGLKKHTALKLGIPLASFLKIAVTSFSALLAVWGWDLWQLEQIPALQSMRGLPIQLSQTLGNEMKVFFTEAAVFCLTAGLMIKLTGATELYIGGKSERICLREDN